MQPLATLLAVIIGGVLVLVGDAVRRKVEWEREKVKLLVQAGLDLLAVHEELYGSLLEAYEQGSPVGDVHSGRAKRHAAGTRLFATPGSSLIREEFERMVQAHRALRESFKDTSRWQEANSAFRQSVAELQGSLRDIAARRRLPKGVL